MKIVLHICCGVCAAGVVERLTAEGHEVLGFFYNPNIHPQAEYERRLAVAQEVARKLDFPLAVAPYTPAEWFAPTQTLENEPEGGSRCAVCFRLRLNQTYHYLQEHGGDAFTTTLTVSPRKAAVVVNRIGKEIGGDKFLVRDFKKQAGFQRSLKLAQQWALYRQNYCGCLYSQQARPIPSPIHQSCIISAVFKSFCHSHASGNPEIVPNYINLDSRSRIEYGTSFTGMTTFDTKPQPPSPMSRPYPG